MMKTKLTKKALKVLACTVVVLILIVSIPLAAFAKYGCSDISVDDSVEILLEPGDALSFVFTAPYPGTFTVFTDCLEYGDPYLYVLDFCSYTEYENDDGGDGINASITFTAEYSGDEFLIEASQYQYSDEQGWYYLNIIEEYNGEGYNYIYEGGHESVNNLPNETTTYMFVAPYNGNYEIYTDCRTSGDPKVFLYDADFNYIDSDDDGAGALNSWLSFTAYEGDVFYIEATGYNCNVSNVYYLNVYCSDTISYDLEIFEGECESIYNLPTETTTCLFVAPYDGDYVIYTDCRTSGDPKVFLYDSDFNYIDSDDDGAGTLNSRLSFTAYEGNVFYIEAAGYNNNVTNAYDLNIYCEYIQEPEENNGYNSGCSGNTSYNAIERYIINCIEEPDNNVDYTLEELDFIHTYGGATEYDDNITAAFKTLVKLAVIAENSGYDLDYIVNKKLELARRPGGNIHYLDNYLTIEDESALGSVLKDSAMMCIEKLAKEVCNPYLKAVCICYQISDACDAALRSYNSYENTRDATVYALQTFTCTLLIPFYEVWNG